MGWLEVIVAAWVGAFLVQVLADCLNLQTTRRPVPVEFRATYDQDHHRRAGAYTRARTFLGWAQGSVELVALVAFSAAGGFGQWDARTAAFGWGPIATGLVYLGGLGLAQAVLGLPFAAYGTFVIEERFGFNRATPATFLRDTALGITLAVVLGGPLVATMLWLFAQMGPSAWRTVWAIAIGWTLLLQYVAPTWILPLFHEFMPLPAGRLRDDILGYAARVGFPVREISVIDGSRRSSKANAFFTGFGPRKRIALFDTLVQTLPPDTVVAVVAHEIGHFKRHHVPIGLAITIGHFGLLAVALGQVLQTPTLFAAFGIAPPSTHAGFALFAALSGPIDLLLAIPRNALSRHHEYQADRFAADTLGGGHALALGLQQLSTDTLAHLTPHPLYTALHASHPPVVERIRGLAKPPRTVPAA